MLARVQADFRALTRGLTALEHEQLPFATAKALTDAAQAARIAVRNSLPSVFDRPTPFTMNAVTIRSANKRNLTAVVYVREKQAGYLAIEETGGTATPQKGVAFVFPKAAGRNQYGNLPKGALKRAKARKDVFVGKVDGVGGFWRRTAKGVLQPLAIFYSRATYRPRFGFRERVTRIARATLGPAFREALAQALRTARR